MIFASIYDYITDFYYLCSANYNIIQYEDNRKFLQSI